MYSRKSNLIIGIIVILFSGIISQVIYPIFYKLYLILISLNLIKFNSSELLYEQLGDSILVLGLIIVLLPILYNKK